MDKKLLGTKTYDNLIEALNGESTARNKYTYFASMAKKEGYEQIAQIFLDTSENEKEHAEVWYKLLFNIGSTKENLRNAIQKEQYEANEMYPGFAKIAEQEGFSEIARLFKKVSNIEARHAKRYMKLLENIEEDKVFSDEDDIEWVCRKCGNVHLSKNAPEICPVCEHKKSYYEREKINY